MPPTDTTLDRDLARSTHIDPLLAGEVSVRRTTGVKSTKMEPRIIKEKTLPKKENNLSKLDAEMLRHRRSARTVLLIKKGFLRLIGVKGSRLQTFTPSDARLVSAVVKIANQFRPVVRTTRAIFQPKPYRHQSQIEGNGPETAKNTAEDGKDLQESNWDSKTETYLHEPKFQNLKSHSASIVAHYLPQFHRSELNDRFWGDRFTEWSLLKEAKPLYSGHMQPRWPHHDIGMYDITNPEVVRRQVDLARRSGITAFNIYFYWFDGLRPLEEGIRSFVRSSDGFPFMLTWANEPWTRRWDGGANETLVDSPRDLEDYKKLVDYLCDRYFNLENYFNVDGSPLFGIYRPEALPYTSALADVAKTVSTKRIGRAVALVGFESFQERLLDTNAVDYTAQFPPHLPATIDEHGQLYWDYPEVADHYVEELKANPRRTWPGVVLNWDNTPRRGDSGTHMRNFQFSTFGDWLAAAIQHVKTSFDLEQRVIFLNAWNEWSEGTYLEPDRHHGYRALSTLNKVLVSTGGCREALAFVVHDCERNGAQLNALNTVRVLVNHLGIPVHVIALDASGPLASEFREVAVSFSEIGRESVRWKQLRAKGVTAVIVNSSAACGVIPSAHEAEIRSILLVHELPKIIADRGLTEGLKRAFLSSHHVVFASEAVSRSVRDFIGQPKGVVHIRPQGYFQRTDVLSEPRKIPALVGCGHGDFRKGFDIFCEVAAKISTGPQTGESALWIGDVDRNAFRHQPVDGTHGENVVVTGFVEDVTALMRRGDVFFLSSREDPYPSVALEALDAGLSLIAFRGHTGLDQFLSELSQDQVRVVDTLQEVEAAFSSLRHNTPSELTVAKTRALLRERHNQIAYCQFLLQLSGHVQPSVTAALLSHHHSTYLPQRIRTIESQTVQSAEFVWIDNSISKQESVASEYHVNQSIFPWRRIHPPSSTQADAWLSLAKSTKTEWIWIAEGDDLAHSTLLEELLRGSRESDVIVFSDSDVVDADGHNLGAYSQTPYLTDLSYHRWRNSFRMSGNDFIGEFLQYRNVILTASSVLLKTSAFREAIESLTQDKYVSEAGYALDWLTYVRMLLSGGTVSYVAAPLGIHRRHEQSAFARSGKNSLNGSENVRRVIQELLLRR